MANLIDISEDAIQETASFLEDKPLCTFSLAARRFGNTTDENRKYRAQQKVL